MSRILKITILIIALFLRVEMALAFESTERVVGASNVAIFYPEAQDPYLSIYQEIISGSVKASQDAKTTLKLEEFVLKKDFDVTSIIQELNTKNIDKVIVLGRLGYTLAKELPTQFNVVSGALPITPNGVSGISLISDPAYLFNYLTQVAPDVDRVHLAYSKNSEWLIEQSKLAAGKYGFQLNAKKVNNTKEAIEFYQALFETNISKRDAIWLPLDNVSSHDKIILPLILEKAWSKEIVVFSSKPSHAKRGALFSTYPDNFLLGQHLYKMVVELEQQPEKKNFATLSSLQLAVNLRTAAHLGLKYSSEQQQQFKLTFPQ